MEGMADFLPESDVALQGWLQTVARYVDEHAGELPLGPAEREALSDATAAFAEGIEAHHEARRAALSARSEKDDCRHRAERVARAAVRQIQADPGVSSTMRVNMGITIRDDKPTRTRRPQVQPHPSLVKVQPLRHVLRVRGDDGPNCRKPKGVIGAEVWLKVGETGTPYGGDVDVSELRFAGMATGPRFTVTFGRGQVGKRAEYYLRWVNTRGEPGPWSSAIAFTIAA